MSNIHPTSIIEDNVKLGKNVNIGPFCHIKDNVSIGDNSTLESHVVIGGNTSIGTNNYFHPFTNIGAVPQDLKFTNEQSFLEIGNDNIFRENATVHLGTEQGNPHYERKYLTKIGNSCLLMVGSHVAHDCIVGNNVILANNATLAGHVKIEDFVIIGGLSAIQQFVRIGSHAIIGGMSGVENDVIPFGLVMGERANLMGINIIGLKRRNFSREDITDIRNTYNIIFNNQEGTLQERVEKASLQSNNSHTKTLIEFLSVKNSSFCRPKTNAS